jgi:hypothetical protein
MGIKQGQSSSIPCRDPNVSQSVHYPSPGLRRKVPGDRIPALSLIEYLATMGQNYTFAATRSHIHCAAHQYTPRTDLVKPGARHCVNRQHSPSPLVKDEWGGMRPSPAKGCPNEQFISQILNLLVNACFSAGANPCLRCTFFAESIR